MYDWSFAPDPNCKGSYYRRIDDIERALKRLGMPTNDPAINFVAYFFRCEKLAFGICSINEPEGANEAYERRDVKLEKLILACEALKLPISKDDLRNLFADKREQSLLGIAVTARSLRNKLAHDFGPQQVKNISDQTPFFEPIMKRFLNCAESVRWYLKANFSHVQCKP